MIRFQCSALNKIKAACSLPGSFYIYIILVLLFVLICITKINSQPTTHNPQPTTHNPQPTTHNPQPTTHNPQPTTHNPQPTTHNPQLTTHLNFSSHSIIPPARFFTLVNPNVSSIKQACILLLPLRQ